MTVTVTPLHPVVGATVDGLDLTAPVNAEDFVAIQEGLDAHSVLVVRGQSINDAQLVSFATRFGRLEKTRKGAVGEGGELVVLSNLDPEGNVVPPKHKQIFDARANQLWHSDASFRPVPAYASLLSGRMIAPSGGQTEFASTRVAHASLDEEMRNRIVGLFGIHHFSHSRSLVEPGRLEASEADHLPPVRHPLVRPHSRTGLPALFIGSHLRNVLGLPDGDSVALHEKLLGHATRRSHVYVHVWKPFDLLIWDNSAVIHRGRPWKEQTTPRHMVRATVADDGYRLGAYT